MTVPIVAFPLLASAELALMLNSDILLTLTSRVDTEIICFPMY